MPLIFFAAGVVSSVLIYTIILGTFFEAEWETILAAVLALIAAVATVYYLHNQQKLTERLHREDIRRRFSASVSVTPLALSELCAYAVGSLRFAVKADSALRANQEVDFEPPVVPESVIGTFRDVIENAEDDDVVHAFSLLVSEVQVHIARQRSLPRVRKRETLSGAILVHSSHPFHHAIIDASSLYIFASEFFDFSRGKREKGLPTKAPTFLKIREKLHTLDIDAHAFPEVYALLSGNEQQV